MKQLQQENRTQENRTQENRTPGETGGDARICEGIELEVRKSRKEKLQRILKASVCGSLCWTPPTPTHRASSQFNMTQPTNTPTLLHNSVTPPKYRGWRKQTRLGGGLHPARRLSAPHWPLMRKRRMMKTLNSTRLYQNLQDPDAFSEILKQRRFSKNWQKMQILFCNLQKNTARMKCSFSK